MLARIARLIGFGILTWLIPFVVAIPFYTPSGLPVIDQTFFKTIMIVVGAAVGSLLLVLHFDRTHNLFLREGIIVGVVWLVINWVLDFVVLLPLNGMDPLTYFEQIGLRYLVLLFMAVTIGYIVERQVEHLHIAEGGSHHHRE